MVCDLAFCLLPFTTPHPQNAVPQNSKTWKNTLLQMLRNKKEFLIFSPSKHLGDTFCTCKVLTNCGKPRIRTLGVWRPCCSSHWCSPHCIGALLGVACLVVAFLVVALLVVGLPVVALLIALVLFSVLLVLLLHFSLKISLLLLASLLLPTLLSTSKGNQDSHPFTFIQKFAHHLIDYSLKANCSFFSGSMTSCPYWEKE